MTRFHIPPLIGLAGLFIGVLPPESSAQMATDQLAAIETMVAAADDSLRDGERQTAESHYRSALLQGWMLMGALKASEGQWPEARRAFRTASTSAINNREALRSLALADIELHEAAEAVSILTRLAATSPTDVPIRRVLAQALVASGQPSQAVQELEEVRAAAPGDLELTFLLASGYLRLKKVDAADRLFADIISARPMAETYVLLGRTYRDAGEYDRARRMLTKALEKDSRVRRAHYYLGTVDVMADGMARLENAIAEFEQELTLAPDDPIVNLHLGMALVEAQRHPQALPALVFAARSPAAPATAFLYLGRCQLALDRPADAAIALRRALELAERLPTGVSRTGNAHYLLATALRELGQTEEAAHHFAEAERAAATRADSSREALTRYLAEVPDGQAANAALMMPPDRSPLQALTSPERTALERRIVMVLAGAYLNLGVMQVQKERFAVAAGFFQSAAEIDPDFPKIQYSLAVAYFNARQYDKAIDPLTRARSVSPDDAGIRRMLAMSRFHTDDYANAADLLRDDEALEKDPALQYAYGVALVRSNRAAEAQALFEKLLTDHGDSAELTVVLGQAHAQQGDYDSAIQSLQRALALKADVAEANAALGVIYLKQGRLPEAADALRAEIKAHPDDLRARHTLATVLDLSGQPHEAISLERVVLQARPGFADARYLLGKILLASGAADEAIEHLEAAVRLAPDEPNMHYQLGLAYQRLGRTALAEQQFDSFRRLKNQRRETRP